MRRVLIFVLLAWAVAFVGSFVVFAVTAPTDFGFTAGMNRVTLFFGWQLVALVLAVVALALRWSSNDPVLRRLAAIPAIAVAVLIVAIGAVVIWAAN